MTVEASLKPSSQRPWVSLGPHAVPHKPGCLNPEAFFVILALSKKSPGFYDLSTLLPTPSLGCVPGASFVGPGPASPDSPVSLAALGVCATLCCWSRARTGGMKPAKVCW